MKDLGNRVIAYAAALSIQASSEELHKRNKVTRVLKVKLLNDDLVEIGGPGLCFEDTKLLRAVASGFAIPQVLPLILNLKNSLGSIFILLKIRQSLLSDVVNCEKVSLGLIAGLSGTAAFANYNLNYIKLLKEHRNEVVLFTVANAAIDIWFYFSSDNVWVIKSGAFSLNATTIFTFKDLFVAYNAITGWFDHLAGPAIGDVRISGNLPFLDKVGYISRKVQQQVPSIL